MSTVTMKFGGTSVGSAEGITRATDVVLKYVEEWDHVAVVVSAMSGVTDLLIDAARSAENGDETGYLEAVETLRNRHHQTVEPNRQDC